MSCSPCCVALQLGLLDTVAAPCDLLHREEPARILCRCSRRGLRADSVLVHQPAQLDEEPVRVGALVELFHAPRGLLVAQAHATQEVLDLPLAGTHVESLLVKPFEHQASDRRSSSRKRSPRTTPGSPHPHLRT